MCIHSIIGNYFNHKDILISNPFFIIEIIQIKMKYLYVYNCIKILMYKLQRQVLIGDSALNFRSNQLMTDTFLEIHETCNSITFYFMKKLTVWY